MALYELGSQLVQAGHLEDPSLVFQALDPELDILVSDPKAIVDVLVEREKSWRALFQIEPPLIVDGGKPLPPLSSLPSRRASSAELAVPGDVLSGASASAGVVRGRARVVRDTASIEEFEPGEILVAPQTDPSWAPLFLVAAGVIVDVGATNSHAMIVSRELGIPCVAGVIGASKRIATGSLVEINGSTGTVTILEDVPAIA